MGRKVALIEDDADVRELVDDILSDAGYRVASTDDPSKAVEFVRQETPDLILCDIVMPLVDGYAVLKALQAHPDTARYPVVFLTAQRGFTERVQAFKFGVVDYVTKPFTREVLVRKVERILQGLDRRSGVVSGDEGTLLAEVKREARTGVLSVKGEGGESKILIQAGEVVGRASPGSAAPAEFRELDPAREAIAAHDPPSLPGTAYRLPSFEGLPELLRTALVAEDNPVFRRFLRDVLTAQGFTVHEAADGAEALRLALEHRPWLILTDVEMPVVDGIEFCRRVRNHSLIRHTPLIFLSGWDDYKERYRGIEAGGDEFLSKETPVRELLIRIQLILQRFSDLGSRARRGGPGGPGMEGGIEVIGAPGFLQMCHLGRLTGVCHVRSATGTFEVRFRDGEIVRASTEGSSGAPAVFEFLSWDGGHFEFVPGDPGEGEPVARNFDQLLLEGCRLLDEKRRSAMADEEGR